MSARDALEAYMVHESDEDAAEYGRRLDAYRAEVLAEAADRAEGLRQFDAAWGARKSAQVSENVGVLRVADELRRLAADGGESRG